MSDSSNAEYDIATRDHDRIRRWVEKRGGYPAEADDGDRATDLRIALSDDEGLTRIDWDDFLDRFDEANLAMAYRVAADEDAAASARVVPADEADLTDADDAEAAVSDEREAARERDRERELSENVDEQSEMRSSEAADEANLDNHRDEPPHSS